MVHGMHHINFIVRDLAQAIPVWERVLGQSVDSRDQLDGRGVDIARFDVGGSWIVLVQPTGPGIPADYLAAHGEGFFLMSLGVDSLADESQRVGAEMFQGAQRGGLDDWRVQDLDITQTLGVQLQYVEG